jgi:hypothetical protein
VLVEPGSVGPMHLIPAERCVGPLPSLMAFQGIVSLRGGLAPFAPHDLRRTAATMCGDLGLSESAISLCLDHQATKGEDGQPLPAITNKVYNLSVVGRVERKRKVFDAWAVELRRIVGEPAVVALLAA